MQPAAALVGVDGRARRGGGEEEKMSRAKPVAVQKTTASRMLTPAWES